MKDQQTLRWLYHNSKTEKLTMLLLIAGNAFFAGCGVLFALACRGVIDSATTGNKHALLIQSFGLLMVIVAQLVLRIFNRILEVRIQGRLEMNYKTKLLRKILHKEYTPTSKYHSGELMNRLTSDVTVLSEGVTAILPNLMGLLTRLFSALTVLCLFDPSFAFIFVAGGWFLFFTTRFFRERLKYLHKNVQEKDGLVRSFMQEVLESMLVVKIFGAESEMEAKATELQEQHFRVKLRKNSVSILANSGVSFIFSLGYLYALLWGSFGLVANTMSFGTLIAILQLVGQVQTPFSGLSGLLPKLYGVIASAERLIELENLPDEPELNQATPDIVHVYEKMHSIELEKVSFGYDRELLLNQAELTINKGDFVLVCGLSGIGKSTLFKLLLGVLRPSEGIIRIKLDDGELISMDRHTRKLFAYVPQGNFLLSGTIRENIAFVKPQAAEEDILAAARVSCAAEFISVLPQGLDTIIGEKGQGLSEGQVQRLAIARAVLSGAPILLLDEATSALDDVTEKKVLHNLKEMTDKTCLIISHKKAAASISNKEIDLEQAVIKTRERRSGIYEFQSA